MDLDFKKGIVCRDHIRERREGLKNGIIGFGGMKRKLVGFFLIFILWVIYRIFGIENSEFVIE